MSIGKVTLAEIGIGSISRGPRARLFGHKASGGKVEVLLERVLDENRALALIRASNSPKPGDRIWIGGEIELEVIERQDDRDPPC